MQVIDLARLVTAEKQAYLYKVVETGNYYTAKPYGVGGSKKWKMLDLFSASAIVAIYDNLNSDNRTKFITLPIEKMAKVALQLLAK
jgi:hypothetical protein